MPEPAHTASVEGAEVPAEPPQGRKYVVVGPNGEQHVTYDRNEARELQAYGRRLRKR